MIEIQKTANDNVLNFFPPKSFFNGDTLEFITAKSVRKSPLAEAIFDLGGVESVLMTKDMISVTKSSDADWNNLKSLIMAEIMDYVATGASPVISPKEKQDEEIFQEVCALIEARIRPAIKKDNGDIAVKKYENGIVYVQLSGNCSGCPYAMVTLKDGVEKILKSYIPQVNEVRPAEE